MPQLNPRTLRDARDLGDQVYELILSNWANTGARRDPNNASVIFPPVRTLPSPPIIPADAQFLLPPIPSLSAIAISPRSLVDRCIIQFANNAQVAASVQAKSPVPNSPLLETEQVLAVGAPLIGQLPGPLVIRAAPEETFGDHLRQDATSPDYTTPTHPFGTALPTNPTGPGELVFITPELRLLLYLTPSSPTLPPLIRAPWTYDWLADNIDSSTPAPTLAKVIPVMGRLSGALNVFTLANCNSVEVVVTGVFRGADNVDYEVPLVAETSVPINESALIPIFGDGCARRGLNFICVYITASNPNVDFGGSAAISVTLT